MDMFIMEVCGCATDLDSGSRVRPHAKQEGSQQADNAQTHAHTDTHSYLKWGSEMR